ncbi:hypothetical protein EYC84_006267 [Monilinia fructicola]|uniref:Bifunctional lycopene cyclase/phytoene synthase n=1 Tax=Monilinia fructicola TaxID=38448 RepID=A0A5M9KB14_MONFR|nr:hypothetical protein EYC84_006267 [Monilinia fructicola]
MGLEYALVHLKYTIPPAIGLTFIYRPFLQRIDIYKILFLIAIAVVSTIPWDAYLIQRKIWTYPPNVVVGPKLFAIPAEELFFFVIQTYNTTLLYLLLSKPIFHSIYLQGRKDWNGKSYTSECDRWNATVPFRTARNFGQLILGSLIAIGGLLIWQNGKGTYLGLILAWAGPFALLLWSLSHQFLTRLPFTSTLLPIALPTLYLWIVDTLALKRGTWTIEAAVFFLATNILIVFGLVAFDQALAILWTFPTLFPTVPTYPSPKVLMGALLTDTREYDVFRIEGIQEAGRLRIDLVLLYSFCRVADDLVDEAKSVSEAREWITKITHYLDLVIYSTRVAGTVAEMCLELVFYHTSTVVLSHRRDALVNSGARMGIALQYINICRDVTVDAAIGRVYIPTSWLEEENLRPQQVVENPTGPIIDKLRGRLLEKAFGIYREARPAIEQIPEDARVSMRVVVESYMEIGRVMNERAHKVTQGKATVPRLRRIAVAWKALNQG